LRYVVDHPVADRCCQSLFVAIGIQTQLLVAKSEAVIIGLIHIRLDAQQLCVQRLRARSISDWINDGFHALVHKEVSLDCLDDPCYTPGIDRILTLVRFPSSVL
jgi:hypothetical protein